ncbi:MAG: HypC/HybG/HupF family hydrogenase formation chaperone [Kiritimatiellae bacterium]|nr:HypC/HybG/HupF family hydrogenase formation chaperone [Kiritimatiellia bacterium]
MCLAVPGKIVSVAGDGMEKVGVVDYGFVRQTVSLAYLSDAQPGEWVLVHVGIAISRVAPGDAEETLSAISPP